MSMLTLKDEGKGEIGLKVQKQLEIQCPHLRSHIQT